jgi:hypothetical protein
MADSRPAEWLDLCRKVDEARRRMAEAQKGLSHAMHAYEAAVGDCAKWAERAGMERALSAEEG